MLLRSRGFPDSIRWEASKLCDEGLTIELIAERLRIGSESTRIGIIACGVTLRPCENSPYSAHDISLNHESNSDP